MAGLNKVMLIGRLGKDPEVKTLPSGEVYAKFSIATSKKWKGKDGKDQEKTEWHNIIAWRKSAELCGKYLSKGKQVYIEGELQTRSWEEEGKKRYATEILCQVVQFLGSASDGGGSKGAGSAPDPEPPSAYAGHVDDEIPF